MVVITNEQKTNVMWIVYVWALLAAFCQAATVLQLHARNFDAAVDTHDKLFVSFSQATSLPVWISKCGKWARVR
jgi:hypothetical protein